MFTSIPLGADLASLSFETLGKKNVDYFIM